MNNKFDEQNDTVKFQFVGQISYFITGTPEILFKFICFEDAE